MVEKIDVAVFGLGEMGSDHVRAVQNSPFVGRIYGVDADELSTRERCAALNIIPMTLEGVLGDESIRLVYVVTPNDTHVDITRACLAKGKAVMCEKPMGMNLGEAEGLTAEVEASKGFLQIGFELRYSKLYTMTKEWIDAGLIGDVVNIQCRYYCCEFQNRDNWRSNSTGSFLIGEKLSHYLDLQRWWYGENPVSVYSVAAPKVVPYFAHRDNHQMILEFPGGKVGTLNFIMYIAESAHHDPLKDMIEKQSDDGHFLQYHICGTKGAIESDVFKRRIRRWEFTDGQLGLESQIVETHSFEASDDLVYFHNTCGQNQRIAEIVAREGDSEMPARDALDTMKLCFAAEKSENERRIVRLDEIC